MGPSGSTSEHCTCVMQLCLCYKRSFMQLQC
jgi:hypothetical protein